MVARLPSYYQLSGHFIATKHNFRAIWICLVETLLIDFKNIFYSSNYGWMVPNNIESGSLKGFPGRNIYEQTQESYLLACSFRASYRH